MNTHEVKYKIAGQIITMPCNFVYLRPWLFPGSGADLSHSLQLLPCQLDTFGWVGGRMRKVSVNVSEAGIRLEVEDGGVYFILPEEMKITALDQAGGDLADFNSLAHEVMLGLGLVFALALRQVWCLHASAVKYGESLMLVLGESGRGKSTLAAYLSQEPGWQQVADDMLPVKNEDGCLYALPHFPQLKMPPEKQPGAGLAGKIPAAKVILLESSTDPEPDLRMLRGGDALVTLLAHTAGTRMFPADLLSLHLDFCSQAANAVEVYAMKHPHDRQLLPLVKEMLQTI